MPPFPTALKFVDIIPTSRDVGYKYGVGSADSGVVFQSPIASYDF